MDHKFPPKTEHTDNALSRALEQAVCIAWVNMPVQRVWTQTCRGMVDQEDYIIIIRILVKTAMGIDCATSLGNSIVYT